MTAAGLGHLRDCVGEWLTPRPHIWGSPSAYGLLAWHAHHIADSHLAGGPGGSAHQRWTGCMDVITANARRYERGRLVLLGRLAGTARPTQPESSQGPYVPDMSVHI